jgi:hypothetical protein
MLTTRLRPEQLKEFEEIVQQTAKKFPADVVRIRHSFGEDWSGDPAIYFRIVLSDEASRRERLADTTRRIRSELTDDLLLDESEYIPYFDFRSRAEQDKLKDPEWE